MSKFLLTKGLAPETPPVGKIVVYSKSDGRMYWKDEFGVETPFKATGGGTGDLLSDGSVALIQDWPMGAFKMSAAQWESTIATGSAPLIVASTTVCANLNADLLDGQEGAYYASVAYVDSVTAGLVSPQGSYDAATNTPDLDTAPSGILSGQSWIVTVAGTFFTTPVQSGDWVQALQDDPTLESHWAIIEGNLDPADYATAAQGALADTAMQDLADDVTPQLGAALDGQGHDLNNLGVAFLTGQAAPEAAVSGKGQLWMKNTSPPTLWFVDDAGNQIQIGPKIESFIVAIGDETTGVAVQADAVTMPAPYQFVLTEVRGWVNTPSSSGVVTIDVHVNDVSILSTLITIDANENSSTTAATPPVISSATIADVAKISLDVTTAGTGAAGAKVTLIGYVL